MGLICLDVYNANDGRPPILSSGGCVNTLIILRERGWEVIPAALIGSDRAGSYVMKDLHSWNIDTRYVIQKEDVSTPIYQLVHTDNGHTYRKHCPECRNPFPAYTPLAPLDGLSLANLLPKSTSFYYFDKAAPAAILLARHLKERGVIIVFEPNRIEDEFLFFESVTTADVMKYSSERRTGIHSFTDHKKPPLEIETAGSEGLNYRVSINKRQSEWRTLPPAPVSDFKDAAGGGDWLTASLIDSIYQHGDFRALLRDREQLENALIAGQKESAYNCAFIGARGIDVCESSCAVWG